MTEAVRRDDAETAEGGDFETALTIESLSKSFGTQRVLRGIDLEVGRGEIIALLGPSGSGKTTMLRLLAGFEQPDEGRILMEGREVQGLAPERRGFGLVFQNYALFPHLTVSENIAFGPRSSGWSRERTATRITELLELVDLEGLGERRIDQISGGQQQRVALARALATDPALLMLDEPLSNLDPSLRERTRAELRRAIKRVGITTVLVTHEQEEAFDLGDRVAVLDQGVLQQVASAPDLYESPATRFVASFIGRGPFLDARVVDASPSSTTVSTDLSHAVEVELEAQPGVVWTGLADRKMDMGAAVEVFVRPEALSLSAEGLVGRVQSVRYLGAVSYARVVLGDGQPDGNGSPVVEIMLPRAPGVGDLVTVACGSPLPRIFAATGS